MAEQMLVFKALLKDKEFKAELRNPEAAAAADALFACLEITRQQAFANSPIDITGIRSLTGPERTLSTKQLASAVSAISPARLEEQLTKYTEMPAVQADDVVDPLARKPKGSPIEIAVSAYLGELFDKAFPPEAVAWAKSSGETREIRLAASYDGWIAIKKVPMTAEKKEIVAACAGIFSSSKTKLPTILLKDNGNADAYQTAVDAFLNKFPERKSFTRLAEILNAAEAEMPSIAAFANGDKKLEARLLKLFYYNCFERAGFTPFVNTEQIGRIWPELKIPKPRGNYGGKKKK